MINKNASISIMRKKAIEGVGIVQVSADEKKNLQKQVADNRITELIAREKSQELDSGIINGVHEVKKEINRIKEDYINLIKKAYFPTGEKVHEDIKLLEVGYPLTQSEIEGLGDKHADNLVMLKLLEKYSKENNLRFRKVPTVDERIDTMELIATMLLKVVDDPTTYESRLILNDEAWEKTLSLYNGFIGDGTNIL